MANEVPKWAEELAEENGAKNVSQYKNEHHESVMFEFESGGKFNISPMSSPAGWSVSSVSCGSNGTITVFVMRKIDGEATRSTD